MSFIYIVVEVIVVIVDRENIVLCARSTSVRKSIHDQEKITAEDLSLSLSTYVGT